MAAGVCASLLAAVASPAPAGAVSDRAVAALRAEDCPTYEAIYQDEHPERLAAAREGQFTVWRGLTARLVPPVDWDQDPYGSHSFQTTLHSMRWIDVLLSEYAESGDIGALVQARDLVIDWVKENPRAAPETNTWNLWSTGIRAAYLVYVARAASCEGVLSGNHARRLLDAANDHGRHLLNTPRPSTNYALYSSLGGRLVADYLPFLARSPDWAARAKTRLVRTFNDLVHPQDAVWLEHSAAYHNVAAGLLSRWVTLTGDAGSYLTGLLSRMEEVAWWFTMPDGDLVQFGDSDRRVNVTTPIREPENAGLAPLRTAGFAFVREDDSYLGLTAGFWSTIHKQADELSLDLYEAGHRVVSDTGKSSYDRDAWRHYAISAHAHSGLVVDGHSHRLSADRTYGSGLLATGVGDGWYAIQGQNPLLARVGVKHRRIFLYRPGLALAVIDKVRSTGKHTYTRRFQLGPDLEVQEAGAVLDLSASGFSGSLVDAPANVDVERLLVRGESDPPRGFTFPDYGQRIPRWRVSYRSAPIRDADFVSALGLTGESPIQARIVPSARGTKILVWRQGGDAEALTIVADGDQLNVSATPASPPVP
jgi:hypothetical protein